MDGKFSSCRDERQDGEPQEWANWNRAHSRAAALLHRSGRPRRRVSRCEAILTRL